MKVEFFKILDSCENLTNWTGSGCTPTLNASCYQGSYAIQAVDYDINDYIQISFPTPLDLSVFTHISFWAKSGGHIDVNQFYVRFYDDQDAHEDHTLNLGYSSYHKFTITKGTDIDWSKLSYIRFVHSDLYDLIGDASFDYIIATKDATSESISVNIDSKIQSITTAEITTDLDFGYNNEKISIYDDDSVLGFEGLVTQKTIYEYYKEYECISFNREVINKKFSEVYTAQTAKEIAEDFITDNCSYLYYSSSIDPDGDFLTDYDIEFKNCNIKEALDTLADLEDAIWWIDPDGKVWMKKFSSLTACGDTVDETTGNIVSIPKLIILTQNYNKATVYGAGNPATGTRWKTGSGHGEDLASQTQYGIIEYVDYYPQLHTQADVDAMSDALVARTGMVSNPFTIKVDIAGLDFVQVGLTIDFSLDKPGFDDFIAANDTYVILADDWNAKEDIHSFTISTGIIQGKEQGKSRNIRTMAVDEEQIDNLAEIVHDGLVVDITPQLGGDLDLNAKNIDFPSVANISDCKDEDDMASNSATMLATQQSIKAFGDAKVSDVAYADTWDGVGGIAPSKNTIWDMFSHYKVRANTGTYTGNGANLRTITTGDFTPKMVMITRLEGNAYTYLKINTYPEWNSVKIHAVAAWHTNGMKFVTNGFQVNNSRGDDDFNRNGIVYYWRASRS